METNVSIMFKNLIFSTADSNSGIMELIFENKSSKFNYPLPEPLKITFSQKFITDKINLTLSVIEFINKKKSIYRADFSINKNIFLEGNSKYEKILTLIPTDYKDTKKAGKIYMEIQLLDNFEEWRKFSKNSSNKKNSNKKTNQYSNKKSNEINKNEFDDGISLLNISNIEESNLNNDKFDELVNVDYINQIKNLIENDYQRILPNDLEALKTFNKNLYNKYREIGNKYNDIIKSINAKNEDIRNKAVNYWNNYKELKKNLHKKRLDLKNNKNNLEKEKAKNNSENEEISKNFQKYKNEKEMFLNKLSSGEGGPNDANNLAVISSGTNNTEIKNLSDAVKKISSLGYDIIDGMKINEEERKLLSVILGINLCDNIKSEEEEGERSEKENQEDYEENNIKEDFEFGNKIVALIERDVNELYSRKLIHQIKIDQIDAITYSFSDDNKDKNVSFKIENNNLFCIDSGESFTVWLLSNFST